MHWNALSSQKQAKNSYWMRLIQISFAMTCEQNHIRYFFAGSSTVSAAGHPWHLSGQLGQGGCHWQGDVPPHVHRADHCRGFPDFHPRTSRPAGGNVVPI